MTTNLPYQEIPQPPEHYTSANIISRFIDGLGYRYYWATEKLNEKDLAFKPSKEGMSMLETIQHLFDLSSTFLNVAKQLPNIRPYKTPKMTFEEYRTETLRNFEKASHLFQQKSNDDLAKATVVFQRGEKSHEFAHWFFINGQLSDAMYHTGQIVSFRRSSGNPINPKVNVFMGKTPQ